MEARDLVRSVKTVGSAGAVGRLRGIREAWRTRGAGAGERARVPGAVREVEPGPGGGVVRFARSELRILVAANGVVFWGWDGAGPEPSDAVAGRCPEPDPRAVLEPDKDGGWRVVAERMTVAVSRHGAVQVCTPGGVLLRRELPPRWWEPVGGGAARWAQRAEVAADARFFGLGGPARGLRLRSGSYPLGAGEAVPGLLVVADGGTHLVVHDGSEDGSVTLREGREGAGSGHDRSGLSVLRRAGGPLRCWVMVGTPARVLLAWTSLAGPPGPREDPVQAMGVVGSDWAGLRASLASALASGLCGVPYEEGAATGAGGPGAEPAPEPAARWWQLAAYLPRLPATGEGGGEGDAQGLAGTEHARVALAERRRLSPYVRTLAHQARRTGAPPVRPVWWSAPEEREARECEDAFLLGDGLLVAPVLTPGTERRAVWLPRGRWYETVTERAYEGPVRVVADAPPDRIPVFARAGAVVPVLGADGGVELEVWAPAPGRSGGGPVVADAGDGWVRAEPERYVTRWVAGRVVVEREDGAPAGRPVRVRGLAGRAAQR
ncbi:TIM-barrel domain-containing protein [Streptomyces sp. NPDC003717]|uniref:TIM-barrel domain-containing protein n=1 Tax=Streptomyces sp. NPDC003717 TaxID=3154276 RepID=UPI0033A7F723